MGAEQIVNSIFQRGVTRGTISVLNYVILALIASVFLAIFTGSGNIHVYVLLFLSIGLLLSVNYFASVLFAMEAGDQSKSSKNDEKAADQSAPKKKTSLKKRSRQ